MKHEEHIQALAETLHQIDDGARWLHRSYTRCRKAADKRDLTPADLDAFEALTGRYARTSDIILQKLFRSLDALEMEDHGTLLDALNRAEKRGLIDSATDFREIRELRNEIAHEYAQENLRPLFDSVLEQTPALMEIIRRAHEYCLRYLPRQTGKRTLKARRSAG
jgi:hypothetical protein